MTTVLASHGMTFAARYEKPFTDNGLDLSKEDGIAESDIVRTETRLGVRLPQALRDFYLKAGGHKLCPAYHHLVDLAEMKVKATVTSTLVLAGQSDVQTGAPLDLYMPSAHEMIRLTSCNDGTDGYLVLERLAGSVSDVDCVSAACPASGGSATAGYGSCGTNCDCGLCWYCESGTYRYGGSGSNGCFRGCVF
jgi:hypothetical protein